MYVCVYTTVLPPDAVNSLLELAAQGPSAWGVAWGVGGGAPATWRLGVLGHIRLSRLQRAAHEVAWRLILGIPSPRAFAVAPMQVACRRVGGPPRWLERSLEWRDTAAPRSAAQRLSTGAPLRPQVSRTPFACPGMAQGG